MEEPPLVAWLRLTDCQQNFTLPKDSDHQAALGTTGAGQRVFPTGKIHSEKEVPLGADARVREVVLAGGGRGGSRQGRDRLPGFIQVSGHPHRRPLSILGV